MRDVRAKVTGIDRKEAIIPFSSKSQQRLFFAKAHSGEIPMETAMEWAHATQEQPGGFAKLPEKVKKKTGRKKTASEFLTELCQKVAGETTPPRSPLLTGMEGDLLGSAAARGQEAMPAPYMGQAAVPPSAPVQPAKFYDNSQEADYHGYLAARTQAWPQGRPIARTGPPLSLEDRLPRNPLGYANPTSIPGAVYDYTRELQLTRGDAAARATRRNTYLNTPAGGGKPFPPSHPQYIPPNPQPDGVWRRPAPAPLGKQGAMGMECDQKKPLTKKTAAELLTVLLRKTAADVAPVSNTNLSALEAAIPALLLGAGGAAYGAAKAPGGSSLRGAVIGGLGGAGAGAGFSAGHHFLHSKHGQPMSGNAAIAAGTMLGGGALGGHAGLQGGRAIAAALGLGDEKDKTDNDLREIDVMNRGNHLLPSYLQDYVRKSAFAKAAEFTQGPVQAPGLTDEDEQTPIAGPLGYRPPEPTQFEFPAFNFAPPQLPTLSQPSLENKTAIDHGGTGMDRETLLKALLGIGVPMGAFGYGMASAPKGHRLHGGASTMEQTIYTGAGGLGGAAIGAMGGAALGSQFKSPLAGALAGGLTGAAGGGYLGNQLGRSMYPGPSQLGLGEQEKTAAELSKLADFLSQKTTKYRVQQPSRTTVTKGKSTIQHGSVHPKDPKFTKGRSNGQMRSGGNHLLKAEKDIHKAEEMDGCCKKASEFVVALHKQADDIPPAPEQLQANNQYDMGVSRFYTPRTSSGIPAGGQERVRSLDRKIQHGLMGYPGQTMKDRTMDLTPAPAQEQAAGGLPSQATDWLGQHGLATGAGAAAGLGLYGLMNQMGGGEEDEQGQHHAPHMGVLPSMLAAGAGGLGGAYLSGGLPKLPDLGPLLQYATPN